MKEETLLEQKSSRSRSDVENWWNWFSHLPPPVVISVPECRRNPPSLPEYLANREAKLGLRWPGRSASPPRPAAGRPAWISIQQHFLSSIPLISQSHCTLSCLQGFYFVMFFLPSLLCDSLCLYFFFFSFLMRALASFFFFYSTTSRFLLFIFQSFLLLSFSAEGAAWKALALSDNLNGNVLIYPETKCSPVTGELPPMDPLLNIITVMSVWSHTQEIK